jgi:hypothetical protein
MNREVKYSRSHANTGRAGRKNWDVKGTSRTMVKARGIRNFKGYAAGGNIDSQKARETKWKI